MTGASLERSVDAIVVTRRLNLTMTRLTSSDSDHEHEEDKEPATAAHQGPLPARKGSGSLQRPPAANKPPKALFQRASSTCIKAVKRFSLSGRQHLNHTTECLPHPRQLQKRRIRAEHRPQRLQEHPARLGRFLRAST